MNREVIKFRGFTLIEMAVVLVILGLLLAGMLVPLSAQQDLRSYNETRQKIGVINEAIVGFALVNGRLPCPASPTLSSADVGAGIENCALTAGVVPWATLGTAELDAWSGRFSYVVTPGFTSPITLGLAGTLTVNNTVGGSLALQVPAVVISHGKNGLGSYRSDGSQFSTTGASSQELQNLSVASPFVYGGVEANFDDFVDWVSVNVLINRMVAAGQLP